MLLFTWHGLVLEMFSRFLHYKDDNFHSVDPRVRSWLFLVTCSDSEWHVYLTFLTPLNASSEVNVLKNRARYESSTTEVNVLKNRARYESSTTEVNVLKKSSYNLSQKSLATLRRKPPPPPPPLPLFQCCYNDVDFSFDIFLNLPKQHWAGGMGEKEATVQCYCLRL